MRIVCLDGYTLNPGDNPWTDVDSLGEFTVYDRTDDNLIVERAREADIVLVNKTPLMADTLEKLPELKLICVLATGYNVVDVNAARTRNIPVCNVPMSGTESVAQFVFAMLLELCHQTAHHSDAVKSGRWTSSVDFCFWDTPLVELAGKKMGIVGFGRIGRQVGKIANAFGMEVLTPNRHRDHPPAYPVTWVAIPDLFAEADVVSLNCPLTDDNHQLVNKDLLGKMKSTAFLINTARGLLVNEHDLAEALNTEKIAGAACDVVSTEPITEDNPLLKAKNIILTPHIAWATLDARKRLMKTTAENIAAFQKGEPINVVN